MEKERVRARKEEVSLDRKDNQTIPPRARIRLVVVLVSLAKVLGWTILSLVSTVVNQATKQITVGNQNRFEAWNKTMLRLLVQVQINRVLVQQMVQCMQLLRMQHMLTSKHNSPLRAALRTCDVLPLEKTVMCFSLILAQM